MKTINTHKDLLDKLKKEGRNKMPISLRIISTCLWCEKEIPFSQNIKGKLLCSTRCLNNINKEIKEQVSKQGKNPDDWGYDKSDVISRPKLYKREPIKKQTEADKVRREGRA